MTWRLSLGLSGAEMCEYGEDATVAVLAVGHVEFREDVADLRFDGPLAQEEMFGEGGRSHSCAA
jgi:hypothetical protein